MGREDPSQVPHARTSRRSSPACSWRSASLVADDDETYDLTNIGTLSAFALVCIGVLVLRYKDPDRPRPFRVPFVWPVSLVGAAACLFVMKGLPRTPGSASASGWSIGLVLYFAYGYRNSVLRRGVAPGEPGGPHSEPRLSLRATPRGRNVPGSHA